MEGDGDPGDVGGGGVAYMSGCVFNRVKKKSGRYFLM